MGRLWRIIKGWWLALVGKAEAANPEAILETEMADFTANLAKFNQNLAVAAGSVERLKGQVAEEARKTEVLKQRAAAAYAAKAMEKAGQMALQLKDLQREMEENKQQLQQAEGLYQNLSRQRDTYAKEARARLDRVKSKISKVKMAEAQAKLAEMASATVFNPDGTGLATFEEKLDERIANAQGKVRVAADSAAEATWVVTESEQKALEASALAEFAQQMGFEAPPKPADLSDPAAEDFETAFELGDAEKLTH